MEDIWLDIRPLLKKVMEKDESTYVESQLLIMERNNYPEETYYTFSYTPIPGDKGSTAGMICANTDDTSRIINERALQTLRQLGTISYKENTINEIYSSVAQVLADNSKDFPFALIYRLSENGKSAVPVAWAGKKENYNKFPGYIDMDNPDTQTDNICHAISTGEE